MELRVERDTFTPNSTIGRLFVAGVFECFTLEPATRPAGVKINGKTAIPEGRYRLTIDMSTRFERMMPHVLSVPDFEGIRIHSGNIPSDTEGCTLLGTTHGLDMVINSRIAFDAFFAKLHGFVQSGEEVWITYEDVTAQPGQQLGLGMEATA